MALQRGPDTELLAMVLEAPPPCPFSYSSPIEWEQSLVAGHPTHPVSVSVIYPIITTP